MLSTKIFYKPTNSFSYPLGSSHVPYSLNKGIAAGEMTRLICNTTLPAFQQHYSRKLINHFKHRSIPPTSLKNLNPWHVHCITHQHTLEPSRHSIIKSPSPFSLNTGNSIRSSIAYLENFGTISISTNTYGPCISRTFNKSRWILRLSWYGKTYKIIVTLSLYSVIPLYPFTTVVWPKQISYHWF